MSTIMSTYRQSYADKVIRKLKAIFTVCRQDMEWTNITRFCYIAHRSGISNLHLTGLFDTVQMMSISGHKDQCTFFDYIKLSSDEIADKIMEKLHQSENVGNEGLF